MHDAGWFRFSTEQLPVFARARALLELRERGLLPIAPLASQPPHVDISKWLLPDLSLLCGSFAGVEQQATSGQAAGDLLVGLNLDGEATLAHRGRELVVGAGDGLIANIASGRFAVRRPTRGQFVGLRVPQAALAPLVSDLSDGVRVIPARTLGIQLLGAYVRTLMSARVLPAPSTWRLLVAHLHDLMALAVGPTTDAAAAAEERTVPALRLRAIQADIIAHLDDEALDVAAVAAHHGITPRYLHRLFERAGPTYSQFVLQERLARAHRMLRDPRFAHLGISTIAYEVGFADLSYFNRTFRRRYGMTPREARRQAWT